MERQKRIFPLTIAFLAIFHLIGIIGLQWEVSRALFQQLVPLNLLLSIGLLAWYHQKWSQPFILIALVVFLAGYGVEVAGVATGKIFGSYHYGAALGPKFWEVPPMIGLNWLMLVYCSVVAVKSLPVHGILKILLAAAMLTGLDFLIEPVAIRFDFWHWESQVPPFQNFVGWFVISLVLVGIFYVEKTPKSNLLAVPLLGIQVIFFAILGILA